MRQAGLFGVSEHLKRLSAHGGPLEELGRIVEFESFRPTLDAALASADGSRGGRPPYDPVAMLKVLILAAQHNVSDARMEYLIRDRLSWLRLLGFGGQEGCRDLARRAGQGGAEGRATVAPPVRAQWRATRAGR